MPKNNPVLPVTESAGRHGFTQTTGTLDNEPEYNMPCVLKDVTATTSQAAPENPSKTWSADNPY